MSITNKHASAVYFVRNERSGAIKIGVATQLGARLKNLKTSSADQVSLICAVVGGRELERSLHNEFADSRLSGEWFASSAALLSRIETLRTERPFDAGSHLKLGQIPQDERAKEARKRIVEIKTIKRLSFEAIGNLCGLPTFTVRQVYYRRRTSLRPHECNAITDMYVAYLSEQIVEIRKLVDERISAFGNDVPEEYVRVRAGLDRAASLIERRPQ